MTVGAETEGAEAVHAARASLLRAIAEGRSAVGSLSPHQIWTCSDADVRELVALHAQLDALSAALGHLIVREADVRDLASKDGAVSTASWLAQTLTLHPGEAKARVTTAEMLSRKATATHA
ncbi:MAG TPA: HNH endonuclease, partial [Sporichthya sp.]|nr:HNH endonuclease [Sporichthya sp.]